MKLSLQPTHAFLGFPFRIPCLRSNVATWGQVYIQRCIKGAWIKHFLYQIYLKLLPLYKQLFKTSTTKMKSVCLILLAMALYCDAAASRQKREEGCACDGTKVETNDRFGTILGECLTADKLGPNAPKKEHFCYVSKRECVSVGSLKSPWAGSIGETSKKDISRNYSLRSAKTSS